MIEFIEVLSFVLTILLILLILIIIMEYNKKRNRVDDNDGIIHNASVIVAQATSLVVSQAAPQTTSALAPTRHYCYCICFHLF